MPLFIWREEGTQRAWLVQYSDDDINRAVKEVPVSPDIVGFERNSFYGAGAVEALMTRSLSGT
jgi:hypothetical protein